MSQSYHSVSSSDGESSNDSLPDLQARILGKLQKPKEPVLVHTISSSDDDDDVNKGNGNKIPSLKYEGSDDAIDSEVVDEVADEEPDIVKVTVKSQSIISKCTDVQVTKSETEIVDPFHEDLPDIQNFTLLTSGLDYKKNEQQFKKDEPPVVLGSKKLRAAEVRMEKEAKRKEREALRQKRALEKAEIKAQREAERTSRRAMKPGECMKYVKVQLDRHLLELPEGSQVISQLQLAELRYEVIDSPVPYTATFVRIDPLSLQETMAEDAVKVVPVKEFLELVERQVYYSGMSGLCEHCDRWKKILGVARLTLVVASIPNYLRGKKTNKQQDFRMAVLGENAQPKRKRKKQNEDELTSTVSRVDIETALVMAQLECDVNHRLINDAEKVAAFVMQVTKSLAEAPYKREKEDSTFSWYAEGSTVNSVKVDKTGVGLLKLWRQQLQQFNNVGPEVSEAIVREYPSPQALVQAYKHSSSEKEAIHLLAHIPVRRGNGPLVSTRRIGPELSKKIFLFFTCTDPEFNLGQKT